MASFYYLVVFLSGVLVGYSSVGRFRLLSAKQGQVDPVAVLVDGVPVPYEVNSQGEVRLLTAPDSFAVIQIVYDYEKEVRGAA